MLRLNFVRYNGLKLVAHFIFLLFFLPMSLFSFSIMLDPAGDAVHTGRCIDNSFERGLTLQYAQQLKTCLEKIIPGIRVIITRAPGETVAELQNAHFANRMDVDLFLSIHFFKETEVVPRLYVYTYAHYDDAEVQKNNVLSFWHYDKIHLHQAEQTKQWADFFTKTLQQGCYNKLFICSYCYAFPFKPLVGIKASALSIEIGLKNKNDLNSYLGPVCSAIYAIVSEGKGEAYAH